MRLVNAAWAWLGRVAEDPRKLLLLDIALAAAIVGLTLVFVFYSAQTHDALCHFRDDLQHRYDRSADFLNTHPDFTRLKFGPIVITRSQMVADLADQKATLKSLEGLNC